MKKEIDFTSLEVDGVHEWDYPDFCDAFILSGDYTDGTPIEESVLEKLTEEGVAYELAIEHFCGNVFDRYCSSDEELSLDERNSD